MEELNRPTSGNEGKLHQHVCHKCGWEFPNPHPSAKQRRSHKKHCGKIDGYTLPQVVKKTSCPVDDAGKDCSDFATGEALVHDSKAGEAEGFSRLEGCEEDSDDENFLGSKSEEAAGLPDQASASPRDEASLKMENAARDNASTYDLSLSIQLWNHGTEVAADQSSKGSSCAADISSMSAANDPHHNNVGPEYPQNTVDPCPPLNLTDKSHHEKNINVVTAQLPKQHADLACDPSLENHKLDENIEVDLMQNDCAQDATVSDPVFQVLPDVREMDMQHGKEDVGKSHPNERHTADGVCSVIDSTTKHVDFAMKFTQVEDHIVENGNKVMDTWPSTARATDISEERHVYDDAHGLEDDRTSLFSDGSEAARVLDQQVKEVPKPFPSELTHDVNSISMTMQLERGDELLDEADRVATKEFHDNGITEVILSESDTANDLESCSMDGVVYESFVPDDVDTHADIVIDKLSEDSSKSDTTPVKLDIEERHDSLRKEENLLHTPQALVLGNHLIDDPGLSYSQVTKLNQIDVGSELASDGDNTVHHVNVSEGLIHDLMKIDFSNSVMEDEPGTPSNILRLSTGQGKGRTDLDEDLEQAPHTSEEVTGSKCVSLDCEVLNVPEPSLNQVVGRESLKEQCGEPILKNDTEFSAAEAEDDLKETELVSATKEPQHKDSEDVNTQLLASESGTSAVDVDHGEFITWKRKGDLESSVYNSLPHENSSINLKDHHSLACGAAQMQVETEDFLHNSMKPEGYKENDVFAGTSTTMYDKPFREEGVFDRDEQCPDASVAAADANGQSDSLQGQWASVSAPSAIHASYEAIGLDLAERKAQNQDGAYESKLEIHAFNTKDDSGHNNTIQAPVLVNPVELHKLLVSEEIQPLERPLGQMKGGSKDGVSIEKVVSWNSSKAHTPLRNLLVQANLESKQKASNGQNLLVLPQTKRQESSQDESRKSKTTASTKVPENSRSSSISKSDHGEWDSPARLPARKIEKRFKAKSSWMPFICCPSIN